MLEYSNSVINRVIFGLHIYKHLTCHMDTLLNSQLYKYYSTKNLHPTSKFRHKLAQYCIQILPDVSSSLGLKFCVLPYRSVLSFFLFASFYLVSGNLICRFLICTFQYIHFCTYISWLYTMDFFLHRTKQLSQQLSSCIYTSLMAELLSKPKVFRI